MMFEHVEASATSDKAVLLDRKLARYLAATAALGTVVAQKSQAAVVANTTVQPIGINGEVNIDFNNDGQTDFQVDHDRVNLNGNNLDYLQIDKNDVNGAANPLAVDDFLHFYPPSVRPQSFPVGATVRNNDSEVLCYTYNLNGNPANLTPQTAEKGGYAVALKKDDMIGGLPSPNNPLSPVPGTIWDFQEGDNFQSSGTYIRANRLIDEDHGQIDMNAGKSVTVPFGPQTEFPDLSGWTGLNGAVRYLGVRVDLNDAGFTGNEIATANGPSGIDDPSNYWYGWIGVRITNEADATGEVVGYAYETQKGVAIKAGDTGSLPGDYNGDGSVNAADYTIWRDTLGSNTDFRANGDNSGASANLIDAADYAFWKSHFTGAGSGAGQGGTVPEPGSLVAATIGGMLMVGLFVARKLFGGSRT